MDIRAIVDLVRADRAIFTILAIMLTSYYLNDDIIYIGIVGIILPVIIQYIAFVVNDIIDYRTDLKNRRLDRPLISGKISIAEAYLVLGVLIIISLILMLFSDQYIILFNLAFLIISILYNYIFKRLPIVGNVVIALTMTAPFIYPYLYISSELSDTFLNVFIIAVAIFGIIRELVKSMEDVEGDSQEGIRTLPVVIGLTGTKLVIIVMIYMYLVSIVYLSLLKPVSIIITIPLIMFLMYLKFKILISSGKSDFRKIHEMMRIIMFVGTILLGVVKIFEF
ncbi:MAG: UbiA family prenyltransferase [Candidatus Anstonellales archaeon]